MKNRCDVLQHIPQQLFKILTSQGEYKMTDGLNYVNIEATGFRDICQHMAELEEENKQLKAEIQEQAEELTDFISEIEDLEHKVEILTRMKNGLKINNSALTLECNSLCERNMQLSKELQDIKTMSMFEFGNTYCSSESLEADGHAFARSLLGHRMTDEEVAIEAAEDRYVPYTGDDF